MIAYFDEAEVRAVLDWDELIATMAVALSAFSAGKVQQPVRNVMTIDENARYLGIMPAAMDDVLGVKLVTFYPANAGTAVPTHLATVMLFRRETGEPLAVMDGHVRAVDDAETAVRGADVVVTATNSTTPVLHGAWLKPGAHVNAVGACRPTWRELDDEAMANVIVVDSREAVMHESGDIIGSKATIYAEAGELFAGTKPVPSGATTIFKSAGIAVEDLASAKLVYEARTRAK